MDVVCVRTRKHKIVMGFEAVLKKKKLVWQLLFSLWLRVVDVKECCTVNL